MIVERRRRGRYYTTPLICDKSLTKNTADRHQYDTQPTVTCIVTSYIDCERFLIHLSYQISFCPDWLQSIPPNNLRGHALPIFVLSYGNLLLPSPGGYLQTNSIQVARCIIRIKRETERNRMAKWRDASSHKPGCPYKGVSVSSTREEMERYHSGYCPGCGVPVKWQEVKEEKAIDQP